MRRRPLTVEIDLDHGGRWTSLRTSDHPAVLAQPERPEPVEGRSDGMREWLWHRPVVATDRTSVRPGEAFVDAGGVEECFPTVAGRWDHGDVWSRPWQGTPTDASVAALGWQLRRRIEAEPTGLTVRYDLHGEPGHGVLHAMHGLYALSDEARVVVPGGTPLRVQDVSGDGAWRPGRWPDDGLDRCGPADGTARLAVVDTSSVRLVDGPDVLELSWRLDRGAGPVSLLLWRNLGGWPDGAPYRSIGVEPLLGAATDVDTAEPDQLARPDVDGRLEWSLRIRGYRHEA
ncbi:hypothetical protein DT076_05750 [Desertihabitans brevis]|uniref:Aldose 1-epimerase n=1 Tax=Desertihabitans brevis TaxID=2268447 RepID=A0A367YWI2_9ACTN|nr:hypothetical protein [Desertihabitans brevis]RCK70180.1 hypothetical protein DT076_05750 [Desertihabitans brevis]